MRESLYDASTNFKDITNKNNMENCSRILKVVHSRLLLEYCLFASPPVIPRIKGDLKREIFIL